MTPEHDDELCRKYPILYRDRHADLRSTAMCWGFEAGDGWFQIIDELSAKLEAINQGLPEDEKIVASQVKEKWGGLRFYVITATDEAYDLIDEAEKKSYETCEHCGKPGKVRPGGWVKVLCDECAA